MGRYEFKRQCTAALLLSLFLILLLLLLPPAALAAERVVKGPAEGWVEFVDIPEADPARNGQIANGTSYLLTDYQTTHTETGYTVFERIAYRIVDRPGLEGGAGITWNSTRLATGLR